ncbi:MAG: SGNH/GDSL hydrolase family protein [Candidatus Hydrogenedentes bacterium]|nr:SGNH/GDSL hydrolase family protein [Candidatus Hydrogenedentota bacterium]
MKREFRLKLKSGLVNAGFVVASLLAAFLAAEVGLRLYHYGGLVWEHAHLPPVVHEPDPETGWRLAPNQVAARSTLDYQLVIKTNAEGLRGPDHTPEPEPDVTTIAVLGDSFMEASQVPEEAGFCHALESAASPGARRVINLGVGGFSTVQAWRQFEARGRHFHPRVVLLAFYAENDVYGNVAGLSRMMWGEDDGRYFSAPFAAIGGDGELVLQPPQYERAAEEFEAAWRRYSPWLMRLDALTKSVVENYYKRARSRFRQKIHEPGEEIAIHLGVYAENHPDPEDETAEPFDELWEDAFRVTGAVLRQLKQDVESAGATLAVFTVPSKLQAIPAHRSAVRERYPDMALDFERPHKRLAAICEEAGIPFLDLLPDFLAQSESGTVLYHQFEDSHWNEAGHALAAERVAAWLKDQGLIRLPG